MGCNTSSLVRIGGISPNCRYTFEAVGPKQRRTSALRARLAFPLEGCQRGLDLIERGALGQRHVSRSSLGCCRRSIRAIVRSDATPVIVEAIKPEPLSGSYFGSGIESSASSSGMSAARALA